MSLIYKIFFVLFVLSISIGCSSSYIYKSEPARTLVFTAKYNDAVKEIDKHILNSENDRAVWLMERGMANHLAERYNESNKDLNQAKELLGDYEEVKISAELFSLVLGDATKPYKGKDWERILLDTYISFNSFLEFSKESDESQNKNDLFNQFRIDTKNAYLTFDQIEEDSTSKDKIPLINYISGLAYELNGQYDEAAIDYKNVYDYDKTLSFIKFDLIHNSGKANRTEYGDLQKELGLNWEDLEGKGSVLVLFECGAAPRRYYTSAVYFKGQVLSFPVLIKIPNRISYAKIFVDNKEISKTQILCDIEKIAFDKYNKNLKGMLIKEMIKVLLKNQLSKKAAKETNSGILGQIGTNLIFGGLNRPDTRGWFTLPANIQLSRIYLKPGNHLIKVEFYSMENSSLYAYKKNINVKDGAVKVMTFRETGISEPEAWYIEKEAKRIRDENGITLSQALYEYRSLYKLFKKN